MLKNQNGFTLMEVLVALFILSILSITAVSGLNAVLRSQSQQVGVAKQLQGLQFTYAWLEQDLSEYVAREIYNARGDILPAMMLNSDFDLAKVGVPGVVLLTLTRGGMANPNQLSSLQRVAYALKDQQLTRYTWPVLDAVNSTVVRPQVLLHNVANIQLRYLSEKGTFYNNWRDYSGPELHPQAMEWQITTQDGRSVTWLFPITSSKSDEEATDITTQ